MACRRELMFLVVITFFTVQVFSQTNYQTLWLVQQWGRAVCKGRRCAQGNLNTFTIHGVWPQAAPGRPSPINCPGPQYDRTKIAGTLRTDLNKFWPDVINGNNDQFWAHEWNRHGTCSSGVFQQLQYFTFALNQKKRFDLAAILASVNIIPNGSRRSISDIKNAIRANTGRLPGLRCDPTKNFLLEIVLCYDRLGNNLIDCTQDNCNPVVIW